MKTDPGLLHLALTLGAIWAWCVFSIGYLFRGRPWSKKFIRAAGYLYRGYGPSLKGSVIGALWGFADGWITGFILGWLLRPLFH